MKVLSRLKTDAKAKSKLKGIMREFRNLWHTENFSSEENRKINSLLKEYKKLDSEYYEIKEGFSDDSVSDWLDVDKISDLNYHFNQVKKAWTKMDKLFIRMKEIQSELDKIGGNGFSDIVYSLD